jgi:protein O-GlcNAc transferase
MANLGGIASVQERLRKAACSAAVGDWPEARGHCADVLNDEPRNAGALHILGAIASCEGDAAAAEEFLTQAISLQSRNAAWLRDLAVLRITTGNWPGALDALSKSLELNPDDAIAISLQARAHSEAGEIEGALNAFDLWAKLQPDAAAPWFGSARCLLKIGRPAEAAVRAQRGLTLEPTAAGHQLLAEIHHRLHEYDRELVHRLELVRLQPGDTSALALSAMTYYHLGQTEIAVSLFRMALETEVSPALHACFLAILLHHSASTPESLIAEHKEWALRHCPSPAPQPVFLNSRSSGRRLHVAYLVAEPANSPIYRFLRPLLRNHDRDRFDVSLYCTDASLNGCARQCCLADEELKDVSGWPTEGIVERMRREGVDILVDVSGHYGGGVLLVTAMRAAPIQVTLPHYPATTGIPGMDYIITDRWTCAAGQEHQYTERPYFLNSGYLVYDPPVPEHRVGALPARRKGGVTFGVFQRPAKLNARVWDAIAEILRRVANSRLLVHHVSADLDSETQRISAELASRAIDPARAQFRGIVPFEEHVRLLATVDIALDSFPYTGQTTTCDCLWMGVPVVTLAGNTHVSRLSAGLLMRVGLGSMVANDVEEYVQIAVRTASDLRALVSLRKGLRRKASTLIDGVRITTELEEAYRWMWHQWTAS